MLVLKIEKDLRYKDGEQIYVYVDRAGVASLTDAERAKIRKDLIYLAEGFEPVMTEGEA